MTNLERIAELHKKASEQIDDYLYEVGESPDWRHYCGVCADEDLNEATPWPCLTYVLAEHHDNPALVQYWETLVADGTDRLEALEIAAAEEGS